MEVTMWNKYNNFLLTVITICLVYISFLKPTPQRYILSKEEKWSGQEPRTQVSNDISVFDTATGKNYLLTSLTSFNLNNGTQVTNKDYIMQNFVAGKIIHKDPEKGISVIGYKEKK